MVWILFLLGALLLTGGILLARHIRHRRARLPALQCTSKRLVLSLPADPQKENCRLHRETP